MEQKCSYMENKIIRTNMKRKSLILLLVTCLLCSCSFYRTEVIALAGFDVEQHFRVSPSRELNVFVKQHLANGFTIVVEFMIHSQDGRITSIDLLKNEYVRYLICKI